MELYTNSHPILISDTVINSFNKMVEDIAKENSSIFTKIYENVIYPNLAVFIIIAFIIIFLLYRYFTHKNKKEPFNKTHERKTEPTNTSEYARGVRTFGGMDSPMERIARPTFNPSIPIHQQQTYVNYLPDEIPVRVNGKLVDNVHEYPYDAPNDHPNVIQYTGPFYRASENGMSDDMYTDFVESNKQNLMEFDDLIQSKVNLTSEIY